MRLWDRVTVSGLWGARVVPSDGRHAHTMEATNFGPCLVYGVGNPLKVGGTERAITRNDKHCPGDAFGLRTISGVAIMRRRNRGNIFVGSCRTDLFLMQAGGQFITLLRGRH